MAMGETGKARTFLLELAARTTDPQDALRVLRLGNAIEGVERAAEAVGQVCPTEEAVDLEAALEKLNEAPNA